MEPYLILVFVHVLGALGVFASFAIEVLAHGQLQQSETRDRARLWTALLVNPGLAGHLGMLAILVTGVWMMIAEWGADAWLVSALVAVAVSVAVYMGMARTPLSLLTQAVGDDGAPDDNWRSLARDRRLGTALWVRGGLLVGIVGLMTAKPGLVGSVAILVTATMAGRAVAVYETETQEPAKGAATPATGS